jgi:uncharacterized protein with PIN domain
MRFVCDAMLGSLARWLRLFGFDCLYAGVTLADPEVAALARADERWLLTRDRALAAVGPPRTLLIRADRLDAQLGEVFQRLALAPAPTLAAARCAECNGELAAVEARAVAGQVPPYVLATAARFRRCLACGRVYWPGTHGERIARRMEQVVAGLATAEEPGHRGVD